MRQIIKNESISRIKSWRTMHLKETSELKKNIILLFLQYIWPTKPFRKRKQMFHRNSLILDWLGQVTKEEWFAS